MRKLKIIQFLVILLIFTTPLWADAPEGYYDDAEGLTGDALKSALNNIIDNHNELSYDQVWATLKDTDEDPNNHSNVILLYTGWSVTDAGYPTWNREHTWAKSHGDFDTSAPCGTDVHHLRPTDCDVNSARGNKDFDNGGTQHSVATGCYYDSDSWEPRDEVKGDVARMIFYMATRYEGENGELDLTVVDEVNTSPQPEHGKLSTLLAWNLQDAPDEFEMTRNDRIYENWQGNRNPFIDNPQYAQYIWGGTSPGFISNFSATPISGVAPLNVQFNDLSVGNPSSWEWDFDNDGSVDSTEQNPNYTYNEIGTYSVKLSISNSEESDEMTKTSYITVNEPGSEPIVLVTQSFESGTGNWQFNSTASSENWEIETDTSGYTVPASIPDGTHYAYINNYNADAPADDWIISSEIFLEGYEDCTFTFNSWTNFSDSITGLKALLSIDGYNWQEVSANLSSNQTETWTQSPEIDLSSYTNSVFIAFRYESTGSASGESKAWAIDNIIIQAMPATSIPNYEIQPDFALHSYPNPLHLNKSGNPGATISFNLPENHTAANLKIYNLRGQLVNSFIINQNQSSINWQTNDKNDKQVPSGIYLMKLTVDNTLVNYNKTLILK